MKVLIIVDDLATSGGTQRTTIMTYLGLGKKGHNVTILSSIFNSRTCYPKLSDGIKNIHVFSNKIGFLSKFAKSSSSLAIFVRVILLSLKSRVGNVDFDTVLVEDEISLLVLALFKKNKRKFVWYLNNQLSNKMIEMFEAKKTSLGILIRCKYLLTKKALSKIDYFATYDLFNKELLSKIGYKNIVVTSVGADIRKGITKRVVNSKRRKLKIFTMGVLFPYRRYEDILRAMKIVDKDNIVEKLTIVGLPDFSQDYKEYILSTTIKFGLQDKVDFTSFVTEYEKQQLFKNSDLFVFVNDANTWGLVVAEAISAGIPVLITNNIGIVDVLDNDSAYIVRPKSPKDIANVFRDMYYHPGISINKSQLAFKKISKAISWKGYVSKIENLLLTELE